RCSKLMFLLSSSSSYRDPLDLHSFPTRRSSDLLTVAPIAPAPPTPDGSTPANDSTLIDETVACETVAVTTAPVTGATANARQIRSEEHTSELQSLRHLVCRLLLEKKKKITTTVI